MSFSENVFKGQNNKNNLNNEWFELWYNIIKNNSFLNDFALDKIIKNTNSFLIKDSNGKNSLDYALLNDNIKQERKVELIIKAWKEDNNISEKLQKKYSNFPQIVAELESFNSMQDIIAQQNDFGEFVNKKIDEKNLSLELFKNKRMFLQDTYSDNIFYQDFLNKLEDRVSTYLLLCGSKINEEDKKEISSIIKNSKKEIKINEIKNFMKENADAVNCIEKIKITVSYKIHLNRSGIRIKDYKTKTDFKYSTEIGSKRFNVETKMTKDLACIWNFPNKSISDALVVDTSKFNYIQCIKDKTLDKSYITIKQKVKLESNNNQLKKSMRRSML